MKKSSKKFKSLFKKIQRINKVRICGVKMKMMFLKMMIIIIVIIKKAIQKNRIKINIMIKLKKIIQMIY